MKKVLFATLLAAGLISLVPEANADTARRYGNHDRYYGRYSSGYRDRHYHSYYGPRVVYRHRPVRVYDDYEYCRPRVRYYESRPRFSFFFGL